MTRSSKANRYGNLAERKLAEARDLDLAGQHTSWHDARFQNGKPVEIKSAYVETGYFQIYKKYHKKLRRAGGYYGLVVYRPRGRGIQVLKSKIIPADRLPLTATWSPTGGHRDTTKMKIPIGDVF